MYMQEVNENTDYAWIPIAYLLLRNYNEGSNTIALPQNLSTSILGL